MIYDISIEKTTAPKAKPADESKLGFGKIFTDHMFMMDYAQDKGYDIADEHSLQDYDSGIVDKYLSNRNIACSNSLHYANEITLFEYQDEQSRYGGEAGDAYYEYQYYPYCLVKYIKPIENGGVQFVDSRNCQSFAISST